ncbi:MAG: hypothetical protein J6S08_06660 [Duodenibacillus sp.]|nr:hypothetical protein [Duodenibacillus sp.]
MTNVMNVQGEAGIREILADMDLGPADSIQFAFAKLQLAQSMICKNNAEAFLKQIEDTQAEQTKTAEMISRARALQNACQSEDGDCPWSKKASMMPADMVAFFKERNLAFDTHGADGAHNFDEWTFNIQSLTNYQESVNNSTQTKMVYLQDMISQYNSYLQGAMSAIQKATTVLERIATSA